MVAVPVTGGGSCRVSVAVAKICTPVVVVQGSRESPGLCHQCSLCAGLFPDPGGVSGVPNRWYCGLLRVCVVGGVLETSSSDMLCCVPVGEAVGRSLCPRV